jgi:phosphomannomutase/phosphoglucomutase
MRLAFNSDTYFREPLISSTGFREYDARWVIESNEMTGELGINYFGMRKLGRSLGTFLQQPLGADNRIIVGHDFRRYSENVKNALVIGLMQSGMNVVDIGLSVSPGAYFAQFALDVPCVAMVTASHNENGWTGIKMGHKPATTFGPNEMSAFREYALSDTVESDEPDPVGSYTFVPDFHLQYIGDLVKTWAPRFEGLPRLNVAVETGNGTAGVYLPPILKQHGFDVVEGNTGLDWNFPHFNPNPESIPFMRSVEELVKSSHADIGLCIDGDGDRLGVVDDLGRLAFADRVGLLIAKSLEADYGTDRPFVIDVKSTSLYETELASTVEWAKTGHSYVKSKVAEANALAGFERSGHFFFSPPLGRGYDDACLAALHVLWVVCKAAGASRPARLSALLDSLPKSFASPNRQPVVPDEEKYEMVERLAEKLSKLKTFAGLKIIDVNRLNGIRITLSDRSWLLVRASSNSPNLVIIAEAFDSDGDLLRVMDYELRSIIDKLGRKIGHFEPLYEI